jgi:hypothetical protein
MRLKSSCTWGAPRRWRPASAVGREGVVECDCACVNYASREAAEWNPEGARPAVHALIALF